MVVKSFTWCSVAILAVLVTALLGAAPVSATNDNANSNVENTRPLADDGQEHALQSPTLVVIAGGCVEPGVNEGTLDVTLTNPNHRMALYTITVDGTQKTLLVPGSSTKDIAFTELAAGDYVVDVTGPLGTGTSATATIAECHERELPIITIDSCGCVEPGRKTGDLTLHIANPNDYAVTYTVRIGWRTKDVFVDAHQDETISFSHLPAGAHEIQITGDDCTILCINATLEQCPTEPEEPEVPGQGGGTPPSEEEPETPEPSVAETVEQEEAMLPTELPNTSAREAVHTATPKQSVNLSSLLLIAVGVPMVAYAAVRRQQQ